MRSRFLAAPALIVATSLAAVSPGLAHADSTLAHRTITVTGTGK